MELMDVYNSKKEKLTKTHLRGTEMQDKEYRFVVSVLIFNATGEMLIQKRQSTKNSWPNWWDYTAGGAVSQGEKLYQAAERELVEELGIKVDLHDVPSRLTVSFEEGWNEIFFFTKDVTLEELCLQKEEVSEAKWVTEAQYLAMVAQSEFIPYIYAQSIFDFYRRTNEFL